jgi:hypothetical protein
MVSYDKYIAGDLVNYSLSSEEIAKNVSKLEKIV